MKIYYVVIFLKICDVRKNSESLWGRQRLKTVAKTLARTEVMPRAVGERVVEEKVPERELLARYYCRDGHGGGKIEAVLRVGQQFFGVDPHEAVGRLGNEFVAELDGTAKLVIAMKGVREGELFCVGERGCGLKDWDGNLHGR